MNWADLIQQIEDHITHAKVGMVEPAEAIKKIQELTLRPEVVKWLNEAVLEDPSQD